MEDFEYVKSALKPIADAILISKYEDIKYEFGYSSTNFITNLKVNFFTVSLTYTNIRVHIVITYLGLVVEEISIENGSQREISGILTDAIHEKENRIKKCWENLKNQK